MSKAKRSWRDGLEVTFGSCPKDWLLGRKKQKHKEIPRKHSKMLIICAAR
jgi:hypothetical protein